MIRQPPQDRCRLVGGDVVQNDMDIHVGVQTFGHMVKEGHEALGAVPLGGLADHTPGGDIQGCQLLYAHIFSRWRNWCLKLAVCPVDSIFGLVFTRGE